MIRAIEPCVTSLHEAPSTEQDPRLRSSTDVTQPGSISGPSCTLVKDFCAEVNDRESDADNARSFPCVTSGDALVERPP